MKDTNERNFDATITLATKVGKGDIWELVCYECGVATALVTGKELAGVACRFEPVYCFDCEGPGAVEIAPAQLVIEDGYILLRGGECDTYVEFSGGNPIAAGIEIGQEKLAKARLDHEIWLHENAE